MRRTLVACGRKSLVPGDLRAGHTRPVHAFQHDRIAAIVGDADGLQHLDFLGLAKRRRRRRHDKQVIKRIEAVLNKGTAAVAAGHFDQLYFHSELAAAGQNRVLGELLQRLRDRTAMLFAPRSPSRQSRSWNEHAGILRAIIDGDERAAATLAAEHVMRAGADFMAGIDTIDELPASLAGRSTAPAKTARKPKQGSAPRSRAPA